ncbi:hypothetical protein HK100_007837 [Physocladia obscura]|uniref:Uncharacterized protein n=1 Tax=Physocladia obscura TaxID=109957 RepID=A0AAD5SNH6_9FUNG|nr:hypothetical protein HK100_007837 [Physocladia obscura]
MTWRLKSWPLEQKPSVVYLTIEEFESTCVVHVEQQDVPVNEIEIIKRNWEAYYFAPIRNCLENLNTIPKTTSVVSHNPFENKGDKSDSSNINSFFIRNGKILVYGLVGAMIAYVAAVVVFTTK